MTDIDKEIAFLEAQLELLTKQIKQAQENRGDCEGNETDGG